ncbi:MAG: hypothetical protein JJ863_26435 [Deltaproteobacteria bacterium]|nr:hypothetical protein [Deltaproteobacteria bacterium]
MLPEDGFIRWLLWAWERLLRFHGGIDDFRRRLLVTPTEEDFPVDLELEGEELVEDYFLFVKEHAGLQGWPFQLVTDESESADGPPLLVEYDPALLATPTRLVAQLARGAARHLVLMDGSDDLEEDEIEPLADATSVFLGFGLFGANAAPRIGESHVSFLTQGLPPSVGALGEHEVAYALALFAVLTEIPDRLVESHLRPNPREFYRRGVKEILRHRGRELSRLRQVPLAGVGPYR